jgi:hypothetical protein
MSTIINATTTNGVVIQPDNSGSLVLQTNSGTTALTISTAQETTLAGKLTTASSGIQFSDSSTQTAAASPYVLKNRIINGDMRIFQRGVAATTNSSYSVDRWRLNKSNDATESVSQNTDAPTGFSYSLRNTISTGDATLGTTQYSGLEQLIEGYNIADFGWGTANAKTVTLSFWVRSSVTGTYTGNVRNPAATRVNPFNFTISVANTWEYKTITIIGDTSGTWETTNGAGIILSLYTALGSSYTGGTAGTWAADPAYGCGSPVNGIASNGNIFAISGVQLEQNTSATPFERRLYNQELANCQRYYETTAVNGAFSISETQAQIVWNTAYCTSPQFKVTKRATPTVTIYSRAGTSGQVSSTASGANVSAATASNISATGIWSINLSTGQTVYSAGMEVGFTASAEL